MTALLSMKAFTYVFLFIIGLVTGSFFNVVIFRYPREKSLLTPRSFCIHCKTMLLLTDIIPLISFFSLKGRCRYCGGKISWHYPVVELLTAMLFPFCYSSFQFSPFFYKYIVFFSILLVISFIDIEKGIIPNRLVLLLFLWSIGWQYLYPAVPLTSAAMGMLAGGGMFYIISVLSKGGMGGGDIKLMAVLGFAVAWPLVFVVFMLAFFLGAAAGVILLAMRKKMQRDPLPFGPFLSLAFFISVFWGLSIWNWYY